MKIKAATRVGNQSILILDDKGTPKVLQIEQTQEEWIETSKVIVEVKLTGDPLKLQDLLVIFHPKQVEKQIEYKKAVEVEKETYKVEEDELNAEGETDGLIKFIGSNYFMAGYENIPMPKDLVEDIVNCFSDGHGYVDSLINFWKLCMLNPNPIARKDLFRFTQTYNVPIGENGYFLGYKKVYLQDKGMNNKLVKFVQNSWLKVRTQKKSPKNYLVCKDYDNGDKLYLYDIKRYGDIENNLSVPDDENLGNLQELYAQTVENADVVYTDAHTRTMRIKIGEPVKQDRSLCDSNPQNECSRGLHVGCPSYVSGFSGDTILAVLVNPAHVIAVPYADAKKLRTTEYLPIAVINDVDELMGLDFSTFEHEYIGIEMEEVEAQLAKGVGFGEIKLGGDEVTTDLDMAQIQSIIESRKQLVGV